MSAAYLLMLFFYWVFLSCVAFITGAFILKLFIIIPPEADACWRRGQGKSVGSMAASFVYAVSLVALISHTLHLILHISFMTDTPLSEIFSILPLFITKTQYGRIALVRSILVLIIAVIAFKATQKGRKTATISGVALSFAVIVSISMAGHQGAKGFFRISFFLDVLHSLAAYVWVGGLFFIRLAYPFLLKLSCIELWEPFVRMITKFSKVATVCAFMVLILGTSLGFFHAQGLNITSTRYGMVFLFKLFNIGILFILGGINKFFIVPRLNIADTGDWPGLHRLNEKLMILVTIEVFIGFVIFLTTGILTHLSPEE